MASLEGWGSTIELHPQVVVLVVLSVGYRVGSREQKITLDSPLAPRGVAEWLARLLWEQEIGSSNLPAPTSFI